jgi:hypothetical protein
MPAPVAVTATAAAATLIQVTAGADLGRRPAKSANAAHGMVVKTLAAASAAVAHAKKPHKKYASQLLLRKRGRSWFAGFIKSPFLKHIF